MPLSVPTRLPWRLIGTLNVNSSPRLAPLGARSMNPHSAVGCPHIVICTLIVTGLRSSPPRVEAYAAAAAASASSSTRIPSPRLIVVPLSVWCRRDWSPRQPYHRSRQIGSVFLWWLFACQVLCQTMPPVGGAQANRTRTRGSDQANGTRGAVSSATLDGHAASHG